jgi:hypothetical protein
MGYSTEQGTFRITNIKEHSIQQRNIKKHPIQQRNDMYQQEYTRGKYKGKNIKGINNLKDGTKWVQSRRDVYTFNYSHTELGELLTLIGN